MANQGTTKDTQQQGRAAEGESRRSENRGASNERRAGESAGGTQREIARREGSAQLMTPVATPFTFLRQFMDDLDKLFYEGLQPGSRSGERAGTAWMPAVEVLQCDGKLVVRADVPGMSKDDIDVEIADGQLVISGERTQEHEEHRDDFYRTERVYGRFYRAIPLPERVEADKAQATFKDGVLEITIPTPNRTQGRRLQVQEGRESQRASQAA